MPRGHLDDPLQNHCFGLIEVSGLDNLGPDFSFVFNSTRPKELSDPTSYDRRTVSDGLESSGDLSKLGYVSFASISLPEMTHEEMTIEEGNWPFPRKVLSGKVTVGDCVLTRADFPLDYDFYVWFMQGVWGIGGPRRHFDVLHLNRARRMVLRRHRLLNCVPKGLKNADLSATEASISVSELTLSVEQCIEMPVDFVKGT